MRGALHAAVAVTLLSACSPVAALNAVSPVAGITVSRDVPYGAGSRRSLDVYAPAGSPAGAPPGAASSAGRAPVIVFIYGGRWEDGDKATYRFVGAALAAEGYLTVVPDYRVFPAVRFPVFLQDAAAAVAWTRANVARYGGDPHRIVLMGHSAGAHIAAMLTLDRQWLAAAGLDADRDIAGMVGLAGPYDFLPLHDPDLDEIFAPAGDLRQTQPITFARGDAPPVFLAAGTDDRTVLPRNTERLAAVIRRDGGQVEERLYPGIDHVRILGAIAWPLRWLAPVLRDVTGFLDRHVGRAAARSASATQASPALQRSGGHAASAPAGP